MTLQETKHYTLWLLKGVAITLLLLNILSFFREKDSSDPEGSGRSGLRPHTDNLTGCQYLSHPSGGITPRLAASGKHLGCK